MHIKMLMKIPELNTFWSVAVAYNCGHERFLSNKPPESSLDYAEKVMALWQKLERNNFMVAIPNQYKH